MTKAAKLVQTGPECGPENRQQTLPPRPAAEPPASAYFFEETHDTAETHTLSVIVDNEPGVLARVIGLFSGRGYNIDSLTVSETEHARHLSRITIETTGTPTVVSQIKNQLARLVPVHTVTDLTVSNNRPIERELALIKVAGTGNARVEALRLADAFQATVVDASVGHFIFEMTGRSTKIEQLVAVDGAARPGRGMPHRHRRDQPAGRGGVAIPGADVPGASRRLRRLRGGNSVHPGPNNIMLMASGLNFGLSRTLPHGFGVPLGFGFMVLVVGFGLGAVFAAYPLAYQVLKFLAPPICSISPGVSPIPQAPTAVPGRGLHLPSGAAFQWVNAKGWVMAIGAVTAYAGIAAFPTTSC